MAKTKKNNSGIPAAAASKASAVYICPLTKQNVYVAKATLKDLKSKSTYANTSKRLWTIPSASVRTECYLDAAMALAEVEQSLLPSYGGRSWEVTCKLSDPGPQVHFRAWKGKMELAVLPHLIEKIPKPPTWPGRRSTPDEYIQSEDADDVIGLLQREISSLSQVAWDLRRQDTLPQLTIKWQSPERKIFHSRKQAWEHAGAMATREVEINKHLLGVGSSGKLLQPFLPSAKAALKVGVLRFERDGLWVVGQELGWQESRPEELEQEEVREEQRRLEAVPTSGLELFLCTKREEYRKEHPECQTYKQAESELRKVWKTLPRKEKREWTRQLKGDEPETEEEDSMSVEQDEAEEQEEPLTPSKMTMTVRDFYVRERRESYQEERRKQKAGWGDLKHSELEIHLRQEWKTLEKDAKIEWTQKHLDYETGVYEERLKIERAAREAARVAKEEAERKAREEAEAAAIAKALGEAKETSAVQDVSPQESQATDESVSPPTIDACSEKGKMITNESIERPKLTHDKEVVTDDGKEDTVERAPVAGKSKSSLTQVRVISAGSSTMCDDTDENATRNPSGHEEEKKEDDINVKDCALKDAEVPSSDEHPAANDRQTKLVPDLESSPKMIAEAKVEIRSNTSKKRRFSTKDASNRWCMNQKQIEKCFSACMDHYHTVMRTVNSRDLHRELQDGFDVFRERGFGRYDMELPAFDDVKEFGFLTDVKKAPWMPVVKAILGNDAIVIHKGCFLSIPGSAPQVYHQDGVHLTTQVQRPCHAINVFIPLVDLNSRNGPTEFCLGSHILGLEDYDRDFVETPTPKAGNPIIFDYRLGHRGMGNSSQGVRPVVYVTYARAADGKEFRDSVNFSRKRYHKIGELKSNSMTREERRNNRKRSMEDRDEENIHRVLEESIKSQKTSKDEEANIDDKPDETK